MNKYFKIILLLSLFFTSFAGTKISNLSPETNIQDTDEVLIRRGSNNYRAQVQYLPSANPSDQFNKIKNAYYVSTNVSITDHADTAQSGSIADVITNEMSGVHGDIILPGNKTYQIKQTLTIPATARLMPQKGASIDSDITIRSANYKWTLSSSGTSEYYLEASGGGNPGINGPNDVAENDSLMTEATVGSLSAGEWDWGDNDTLGYNTVYVRLSDSTDPDGKAADYVEACYTLTINGPSSEFGPERLFKGNGSISVDGTYPRRLYPEWWYTGSGTWQSSVQAAADAFTVAGGVIVFSPNKKYTFDTDGTFVDLKDYCGKIEAQGATLQDPNFIARQDRFKWRGGKLVSSASNSSTNEMITSYATNSLFQNIYGYSNETTKPWTILELRANDQNVDNCKLESTSGLQILECSRINISNSRLASNVSDNPWGIYSSTIPVEDIAIDNCIMKGYGAVSLGDFVYIARRVTVTNCTVYNNESGEAAHAIKIWAGDATHDVNALVEDITIDNLTIYMDPASTGLNKVIDIIADGHAGYTSKVRNVEISNIVIHGRAESSLYGNFASILTAGTAPENCLIENIAINDCIFDDYYDGAANDGGHPGHPFSIGVKIEAGVSTPVTIDTIKLSDLYINGSDSAGILIGSGTDNIIIDGLIIANAPTSSYIGAITANTDGLVTIRNTDIKLAVASSYGIYSGTGKTPTLVIDNVTVDGTGYASTYGMYCIGDVKLFVDGFKFKANQSTSNIFTLTSENASAQIKNIKSDLTVDLTMPMTFHANADIQGDQMGVCLGNISSNVNLPIYMGNGPSGTYILDAAVVVTSTVAAHATDYVIISLRNKGADGVSDIDMGNFDTATGGSNITLTAYDATFFCASSGYRFSNHPIKDTVITFKTTMMGSGVLLNGTGVILKIIDY